MKKKIVDFFKQKTADGKTMIAGKFHAGKKKLIFCGILFLCGVFFGMYLGGKPWKKEDNKKVSSDSIILPEDYTLTVENVKQVLAPAGELVTTKYFYTDIGTYENYKEFFGKKVPFTTEKTIFCYNGEISIGIDITEVTYEIDEEKKLICITLPTLQIIANEIDDASFEFFDVSHSIFNEAQMEDYANLAAELKEEKAEEVLKNTEFMQQARLNTEYILSNFLTASDLTAEYKAVFE